MSKSPKSPKPENITAAPRYKAKKANSRAAAGREAALNAVRAIADRRATKEDMERIQEEAAAEKNDRGYALLLASNLENVIQITIERIMRLDLDPRRKKELFGGDRAPLGTFSNKIIFAHSLRIFGESTRSNLDIMRTIRNAFAHAKIALSFNDVGIAEACKFLEPPTTLDEKFSPRKAEPKEGLSPRELYKLTSLNISYNLVQFVRGGSQYLALTEIKTPITPYCEVWMRPKPLP